MTTNYAMELSPAGFDEMLNDLSMMDRKTGWAYLRLLSYLRRFGSVPSGEKALASILGVTVRYLHTVAWDLLGDRVELSEDAKRYFDPDVRAVKPRRSAAGPVAEKAKQQQEAALTRWRGKKSASERMQSDAQAHVPAHPDACGPHAETHAISMTDASKTHAKTHPDRMRSASAFSGAPSLSLSSSSLETPEESQGESERARAGADAPPDAQTHAPAHPESCETDAQPHAQPHARPHAELRGKPASPGIPLPAAWRPNAEGEREAKRWGYDAEALAEDFIPYYRGRAELRGDWDAAFLSWCRRQADRDGRRRQGHLTMPIPGGAATAAATEAAKPPADPLSALRALYYRPPVTGPKPPSDELFVAECVRGMAVAANQWVEDMTAWITRHKTGDRPAEFLEFTANYDAGVDRKTG